MTVRIYNTLTGNKEEFIPTQDGKVGMYVCGVTVYDLCHIGHARSTIVFDIIFRYFKYKGYDVTYIRNFTDVDDNIINKAGSENVSCREVSERYIDEFKKDMKQLGIESPTIEPRATEHIADMIETIEQLFENGYAYQVEGDVFFSVSRFKEYGKLSGRALDEMSAGARIEVDERKENPLDFVLWKASKEGEPSWDSPWGKGRPGWHIECSSMSQRYLGETFDIHGGGKDLIFPHHENEIAQSEGATGRPFVRYWVHNGFVNIDKEKMSKSLGNFFTIKEVLERYHPEVIRLFLLSSHYRSPVDFSDKNIEKTKKGLDRIYSTLKNIDALLASEDRNEGIVPDSLDETESELYERLTQLPRRFEEAMDDDFNTALAIGYIYESVRALNRYISDKQGLKRSAKFLSILNYGRERLKEVSPVLALFIADPKEYFEGQRQKEISDLQIDEGEILRLIEERAGARREKDWPLADDIRDRLLQMGIVLEDGPDGTLWKVKRDG
ncbi:MAG: cysteine--tRNA ligase [Thermodesulfobacteriota bacterium]|nr:cysteine--tRNA ligase [Thermodesulfobacteriota bacterium]